MEFEAAYLQNASAVSSRSEDNQRQWLENNNVWERWMDNILLLHVDSLKCKNERD